MSARRTVLVIDDSPVVLRAITETLRGEYRVLVARSGQEGLERLAAGRPELVLLDLVMPGIDGYETCARLKSDRRFQAVPVIFMTGLATPEEEARGFAVGAADFVRKPFEPDALRSRVKLQLDLASHREFMEELVERRTRELVETQKEVVFRLARAAEYRDSDTGLHIKRLALYCRETASRYGLTRKACELVYYASMMHDVGKIGIPDRILLKTGSLDPDEWTIMRSHTSIGERLLDGHDSEILIAARRIAGSHHEKWDGSGYPRGLRGDEIPLEGRITAICDVYDALLEARPYKPAWPQERAIAEIRAGAGKHFDPEVVEAFDAALPDIEKIRAELVD